MAESEGKHSRVEVQTHRHTCYRSYLISLADADPSYGNRGMNSLRKDKIDILNFNNKQLTNAMHNQYAANHLHKPKLRHSQGESQSNSGSCEGHC